MLTTVPITVWKAGNNYNAYSDTVPGCMATGRTIPEVVRKLQAMLPEQIRSLIDAGKLEPDELDGVVSCTLVTVDVPMPTDEKSDWPQILFRWRKSRGFTQRVLASELEVAPETISEWERGARKIPGPVRLLLKGA